MTRFRAMGCAVEVSDDAPRDDVRRLFDERDRRFSRFRPDSELSRLNRVPAGASLVSDEFSRMLGHALGAARSTGSLVTPTVGAAVTGAGYDPDFDLLPADGAPVAPVEVPPIGGALAARAAARARGADRARSQLCRQGSDRRRRTRAARRRLRGCRRRRGDLRAARRRPARRAVPSRCKRGGLATSSVAIRRWLRGGEPQHHLIDPATGRPAEGPWRDVTRRGGELSRRRRRGEGGAPARRSRSRRGSTDAASRGRFVDHDGAVHVNETWRQAAPLGVAA